MAVIAAVGLTAVPAANAQDAFVNAVPIREVTEWHEAPAALGRSYRRSRFTQSSISIASGLGALIGGSIQLSGHGLQEDRNPVVGVLLITGAVGSMTVGTLGLLGPFSDSELQAEYFSGSDDEESIKNWVFQRQTVARHARMGRAIALGATATGLLVSAAVVQDPSTATEVAGVEAIAGQNASIRGVRTALVLVGLGTGAGALFTGLLPGAEDRVIRNLANGAQAEERDLAMSFAFTGTGGSFRATW